MVRAAGGGGDSTEDGGVGVKEILGGNTRATYGITVFLRELASGRQEARVVSGPPKAGLLELAAELDARTDGVWVVQTYSTPTTIYNDLARGRGHDPFETGRGATGMPEAVALGQIGRLDLCAPALLSRDLRRNGARGERALRRQAERLAAFAA